MLDIGKKFSNIEMQENGIWFSKGEVSVHSPDEGNVWCQQIEENSFWFRSYNQDIG
jgi:hypothetical protein